MEKPGNPTSGIIISFVVSLVAGAVAFAASCFLLQAGSPIAATFSLFVAVGAFVHACFDFARLDTEEETEEAKTDETNTTS